MEHTRRTRGDRLPDLLDSRQAGDEPLLRRLHRVRDLHDGPGHLPGGDEEDRQLQLRQLAVVHGGVRAVQCYLPGRECRPMRAQYYVM